MMPAAYAWLSLGVLGTVLGSRPLARALDVSPLREIGQISYGLYLYHLPIYVYCGARESAARAVVAIAATFVAATLSFVFVERPLMRQVQR